MTDNLKNKLVSTLQAPVTHSLAESIKIKGTEFHREFTKELISKEVLFENWGEMRGEECCSFVQAAP